MQAIARANRRAPGKQAGVIDAQGGRALWSYLVRGHGIDNIPSGGRVGAPSTISFWRETRLHRARILRAARSLPRQPA